MASDNLVPTPFNARAHVGANEPADSPDDANVGVSVPFLPQCIRRLTPTCALTNLLVHSDERTEFVVATRNITNKSSFGPGALPGRERRRSISRVRSTTQRAHVGARETPRATARCRRAPVPAKPLTIGSIWEAVGGGAGNFEELDALS